MSSKTKSKPPLNSDNPKWSELLLTDSEKDEVVQAYQSIIDTVPPAKIDFVWLKSTIHTVVLILAKKDP